MKDFPPYDVPGRWYKIFIESDGSTSKITTADIDAVIDNSMLVFPIDFHIVNEVYDVNSVTSSTSYDIYRELMLRADGKQAIPLPEVSSYDYADIYVLGYFK